MVGPVRLDQDLHNLPYIAPKAEFEEKVLTRYPHPGTGAVSWGLRRNVLTSRRPCSKVFASLRRPSRPRY